MVPRSKRTPQAQAPADAQATVNDELEELDQPAPSGETFPDPDTFANPPAARLRPTFGTVEPWGRIANHLVGEIIRGRFPIGARLPSVRQLAAEFGVSERPAQRALQALASAGVAQAADRSGYYVTAVPDAAPAATGLPGYPVPTGAPIAAYPQQVPQAAPILTRPTSLVPIEGSPAPALSAVAGLSVTTEQAPPDIAQALHLTDPTAAVIVRRRLLTAQPGHPPTELRSSYLASDAADATPLIAPAPIAEPWPAALAEHARRTPAEAVTYASARRPTDAEAAALMLAPTAIVLVRDTVTADANGRPVDLTRSVWPAESTTLSHRYPLNR